MKKVIKDSWRIGNGWVQTDTNMRHHRGCVLYIYQMLVGCCWQVAVFVLDGEGGTKVRDYTNMKPQKLARDKHAT